MKDDLLRLVNAIF